MVLLVRAKHISNPKWRRNLIGTGSETHLKSRFRHHFEKKGEPFLSCVSVTAGSMWLDVPRRVVAKGAYRRPHVAGRAEKGGS